LVILLLTVESLVAVREIPVVTFDLVPAQVILLDFLDETVSEPNGSDKSATSRFELLKKLAHH
jgi:hypothetical protein